MHDDRMDGMHRMSSFDWPVHQFKNPKPQLPGLDSNLRTLVF
jgi:hypothetical protein